MDQLGDAMAQVLQHFKLGHCFALGEGAGADICCRFAVKHIHSLFRPKITNFQMDYPTMVKGLVLVHCTSTPHGIVEHIKEIVSLGAKVQIQTHPPFLKLINLRLDDGEMTHGGWNYLLTHRFGNVRVNWVPKWVQCSNIW